MAEKKEDPKAEAAEAAPPKPKRNISGIAIAAGVNLVIVLAVLGFMVYSKLIYKRPIITEPKERARVIELSEEVAKSGPTQVLDLPPVTVNIVSRDASSSDHGTDVAVLAGGDGAEPRAKLGSPSPLKGRIHYALVGTSLEYNDPTQEKKLKELIPVISDKISTLIAKKSYSELTNVQGRFILRQQVIDTLNRLLGTKLIVNVYFPQFLVQ
ncbi:MAG: flagellar basal body-associated FliL family protein [Bdellovibrionota bacterium]